MRIVTSAEMRELETLASKAFDIESISLMEMAAEALADAVARLCMEDTQILVLCGPGNNGGDGLAAARLLEEQGYSVTALLATETSKLKGDALTEYRRLAESEVKLHAIGEKGYDRALRSFDDYDIIVDALLGTGAKGAPTGEIKKLVDLANEAMAYIISADVPTGIDADTGIAAGSYISASVTVTFALPKPFLFQNDGLVAAGDWQVADIGLPDELVVDAGSAFLLDHWWASGTFPVRSAQSHKRNSGVVLCVAGSDAYPGALALCARGALRAGAGLVKVASTRFAVEGVRNTLPECPVLVLPDDGGAISPDAAVKIAAAAEECHVVALGPGLGRTETTRRFLSELWKILEASWVIDADALYWISQFRHRPKGEAIYTPHEGEAARLLGKTAEQVRTDRAGAAVRIAEKFGQTVLLKGAYSVIAQPGHDIAINPTGNPSLATGGTGDVLTGVVAALMAAGTPPQPAAALGAFWHGAAADMLTEGVGVDVGFLASEIADALPTAKSSIEAGLLGKPLGEAEEWEEEDEYDDFEEV